MRGGWKLENYHWNSVAYSAEKSYFATLQPVFPIGIYVIKDASDEAF